MAINLSKLFIFFLIVCNDERKKVKILEDNKLEDIAGDNF